MPGRIGKGITKVVVSYKTSNKAQYLGSQMIGFWIIVSKLMHASSDGVFYNGLSSWGGIAGVVE
jgi:hypothetical protein